MSRLRRVARFLGLAALALGALLAIGLLWVTDPLDRSPIAGSAVEAGTSRLLDAEAAALAARGVDRGPLRAGWATASITPPLGTPTLGYGNRLGRGISTVADELRVGALAVAAGEGKPVVFVTADLCLWLTALSERIAAAVAKDLPRERLYFGATHTHCGPSGFVKSPALEVAFGTYDPAIVDMLASRTVEAIRGAIATMEPAMIREKRASAPEFVENRMRKGEALDDELVLVEWHKRSGKRLALVVFSAHATAIDHSLVVASGDYPGALCRALEADLGYDRALFFAGATGQAGPELEGRSAYAPTVDVAHRMGAALGARVGDLARESAGGTRTDGSIAVFRSEVRLPKVQVPAFLGRVLEPPVAGWVLGREEPLAHVQAVGLGFGGGERPTIFVSHSFEFSSVLTRGLKERARAAGGNLVLTGLNGDHNMYVIPDGYYDDGRYESGATIYGPHLGSYLEKVTERVFSIVRERL